MQKRLMSLICGVATSVLLLTALPAAAHFRVYSIVLSGGAAVPPNASPATGTGTVSFDLDAITMRVQANFSGLVANDTAAHIHCCANLQPSAIVATTTPTFTGFPSGVTSGSYDHTFDLSLASSYNAAFITANGGTVSGALNALLAGADAGKAYLDIHTTNFPGGEIRGVLVAQPRELLDADGSQGIEGLTDGVLVLRYMFGLTGAALTNGALNGASVRTDPAAIKDYLDHIRTSLDIDGNGTTDALTDGLLIVRYLFGLRGNMLLVGAVGSGASRKTSDAIETYIQSLME